MKKLLFLCFALAPCFTALGADFYWVGGTGEWDDVGHWATTSGGTIIHFGIPSANDDVYFDANSFQTATDVVDFLNLSVQCRSLAVTTPLAVTFIGTGTFTISGHLDLSANVFWNYRGRVEFRPGFSTTTLNGRGHELGSTIHLVGNNSGGWNVESTLSASSSINTTASQLNFSAGVELIASTVSIESDGSTDYSNLTCRAIRSIDISAVPSEAPSLALCDIRISGSNPEIRLDGIAQFPLRSIWLNSTTNSTINITHGYGSVRTTEIIADTLIINSNCQYQLDLHVEYLEITEGTKQTFYIGNRIEVASMKALGNCLEPIYFEGRNGTEFIASASASLQLEHIHVDDITATGGSTWDAPESSGTGTVGGWNFNSAFGDDRFWVGNSGSWDDEGHWSYSSGGAPGACPPKAGNNVIFDAASFSIAAQQIDIPAGNWAIKSLDCSGVSNNFTLFALSSGSMTLYGSMTLSPRLTWTGDDLPYFVQFKGPQVGRTILTHGKTDHLNLYFLGTGGDWTLQDSISVAGFISIYGGTLNTSNYNLSCRKFQQYSTLPSFVDLGTSLIHIREPDPRFRENTGIRFSNCISKDASIFIEEDLSQTSVDFGINSTTGTNDIDKILSLGPIRFTASNDFFANVVDLREGALIRMSLGTIDSLLLDAGSAYNFNGSSNSSDITLSHLSANGSCLEPIILNGDSNCSFTSTNAQIGEYLQIQNIDAIGGPWTANESVDLGDNTGWIFAAPPSGRSLYWSGGTGTWFDSSHWSETNGGPTGACPPTRLDDVFFEAGSLSASDTVYLSQTTNYNSSSGITPECKTFDARGLNGTGTRFAGRLMYVYGSLYIPTGADFILRELFLRDTLTTAEILIEGKAPGEILFEENGIYTAIAPINAPGLDIGIRQGIFRTNGFPMEFYEIKITGTAASPGTLDLGNSEVKLHNGLFAFTLNSSGRVISNDAWIRYVRSSVYVRCAENTGGVNMEFPSGGTSRLVISARNAQADFTTLKFGGSSVISGDLIIDSLILSKGVPYTITNSASQDMTIREYMSAVGSACSPIPMSASSTATVNSTIQFENAAISAMDYVRIDRIDANGPGQALAGRNSINVADLSNGWIYQTVPSVRSLDRYFLGSDISTCANTPDLISPTVPPAFVATYEWQDGSTDRDFQPPTSGAYYLDITFEAGTCQLRDSIIISGPEYDLDPDENISGCGSTEVRIANANPTVTGYRWIAESGSIINTDANGADVAVPGVYFLEQTVGACSDSTRYEVNTGSSVTKDSLLQFCGSTTLVTSQASYQITQDTSFIETFTLPSGCDSILQISVIILETSFSDSLVTGCSPVEFTSSNGTSYSVMQDSIIEEDFTSSTGCDSVRRYEVQIFGQPVATTFSQSFCSTDTLTTPTDSYLVSNDTTIIEQLVTATGCDSTATWNIFVNRDTIRSSSNQTWCETGTFTTLLDTYQISNDTVLVETYSSLTGCDSIHTYTFEIQEVTNTTQNEKWCAPNTLTTNQATYIITTDSTFTESYTSHLGCDSSRTYSIIISDTIRSDTNITLCALDIFTTNQNNYLISSDTSFSETYVSSSGCDSIRSYNFSLESITNSSSTIKWCTPDTLTTNIGSYYINKDSIFTETYQSFLGCDSMHTYSITILPEIIADTTITGCDNLTFTTPLGFYSFTRDTTFTETYTSSTGCDSFLIYFIQLTASEYISDLIDVQSSLCSHQNDGQINLWDPTNANGVEWLLDGTPLYEMRTIANLSPGEYELFLSYGEDCRSDTIVTLIQPPVFSIDFPDTIFTTTGKFINLFEAPQGGTAPYTYYWSAQPEVFNIACPLCPILDFQALSSGWITADIQDLEGCSLKDSIWLEVRQPETFYLPNAFSPNNDGVNDILRIYGKTNLSIEDIKVFDRWGNLVYEGIESATPLIATIWDGQNFRAGTYVVQFSIVWSDGSKENVAREVTLIE